VAGPAIAGFREWVLVYILGQFQVFETWEVDVNSKDSYYGRTLLLLASENGHESYLGSCLRPEKSMLT
jgi:hypothetical protein